MTVTVMMTETVVQVQVIAVVQVTVIVAMIVMIVKQKQLKGAKFEINRESIEFDQLRLEQKKIKNKC